MSGGGDRLTGLTPDRLIAERIHEIVLDRPWIADAGRALDVALEPTVLRIGLVAVAVPVCLARIRRPLPVAVAVVLAIVVGHLMAWVKAWIGRPRPVWADPVMEIGGTSMPSLHAFNAALLLVLALRLVSPWSSGRPRTRRVVHALAGVTVLLAGVDRLVVGVHYPTDVLVGWSLGAAGALVIGLLLPRGTHRSPCHRPIGPT